MLKSTAIVRPMIMPWLSTLTECVPDDPFFVLYKRPSRPWHLPIQQQLKPQARGVVRPMIMPWLSTLTEWVPDDPFFVLYKRPSRPWHLPIKQQLKPRFDRATTAFAKYTMHRECSCR